MKQSESSGMDTESRRVLRLALGTSLSLCFSQVVGWQLSFIAPVFTMFILALPLPAPSFASGVKFVMALLAPATLGALILPFVSEMHGVLVLLTGLCLFHGFYFSAKGGSPLLSAFITLGITLVVTIGSVHIQILTALLSALAMGAAAGMLFVWVAFAAIPDPPRNPNAAVPPKPKADAPSLLEARMSALRSTLIVLPLAVMFLFSSASTSYVVVMIKVASMGQQANVVDTHGMARSQIESTLWGGLGAIIAWQLLSIWPSLLMYTLLIALAALLYGPRIFEGEAMHPRGAMWSYAFLTMIVLIAPAVSEGQSGGGAGAAFWSRFGLFIVIALYGSIAVAVFDAFRRQETMSELNESA